MCCNEIRCFGMKYEVLEWNTKFWNEMRSFRMTYTALELKKYEVLEWSTMFGNDIQSFGLKYIFWNEIRSFGVKYEVLEWSSTPNFQSGWKDANPVKIINHMSAWFCVIVREVCVKYQVFAWNTKFLRDLGPLEISRISAQKVIALGVQKMSNVQIWWHVVNSSQISRNFTHLSNQNCCSHFLVVSFTSL